MHSGRGERKPRPASGIFCGHEGEQHGTAQDSPVIRRCQHGYCGRREAVSHSQGNAEILVYKKQPKGEYGKNTAFLPDGWHGNPLRAM
jgi:hypothetical protein